MPHGMSTVASITRSIAHALLCPPARPSACGDRVFTLLNLPYFPFISDGTMNAPTQGGTELSLDHFCATPEFCRKGNKKKVRSFGFLLLSPRGMKAAHRHSERSSVWWLYACCCACLMRVWVGAADPVNAPRADASHRLLFFVPGASFRHVHAFESILSNLNILTDGHDDVHVECVISLYDDTERDEDNLVMAEVVARCHTQVHFGGSYADHIKSMLPSMVRLGGFTHVALVLDDVSLHASFDTTRALGIMEFNKMAMVSPIIFGGAVGQQAKPITHYLHSDGDTRPLKTGPIESSQGRIVDALEVHALFFTLDGWECFWDVINPKLNGRGTGYERFVLTLCTDFFTKKQAGVYHMATIYTMAAMHRNWLTGSMPEGKDASAQRTMKIDKMMMAAEPVGKEEEYTLRRFMNLMREAPCGTRHKLAANNSTTAAGGRRRRRRAQEAATDAMPGISVACASMLAQAFQHKADVPWREWSMYEKWERKRNFVEAKFTNVHWHVHMKPAREWLAEGQTEEEVENTLFPPRVDADADPEDAAMA